LILSSIAWSTIPFITVIDFQTSITRVKILFNQISCIYYRFCEMLNIFGRCFLDVTLYMNCRYQWHGDCLRCGHEQAETPHSLHLPWGLAVRYFYLKFYLIMVETKMSCSILAKKRKFFSWKFSKQFNCRENFRKSLNSFLY
jgi:hypothetical protein